MNWSTDLFTTCRETARCLSDAMDYRLPWYRRIRMHYHLHICPPCKQYQHQLALLRTLIRRMPMQHNGLTQVSQPGLSAEAKARIRRLLDSSPA